MTVIIYISFLFFFFFFELTIQEKSVGKCYMTISYIIVTGQSVIV